MNSECERLQGFVDYWTLIGKPEEVEVKEYETEWKPGKDCKYSSVREAMLEHYGWDIEADDEEYDPEYDQDPFDPKDYGFVERKFQVGSHKEIQYFYTDRFGKKKKCSDSNRYKALGNSIAVGYANQQSGFWCWLARRISAQYERQITLGSLFDGIGGFPLAFAACGARPVWASEIEEFCIEVTRRRFPEPGDVVND